MNDQSPQRGLLDLSVDPSVPEVYSGSDFTGISTHQEPILGASLGAVGGAAIVFAARKTDAQSFVTVEDFWGGLLVGFLIGYSGTAAFSDITGVKA
jgi:hypothetical protein